MPYLAYYLVFIGKLARVEFGINEVAVDAEFETTARRGNQLERFDLLLVTSEQLTGQADRLGLVVSNSAVS